MEESWTNDSRNCATAATTGIYPEIKFLGETMKLSVRLQYNHKLTYGVLRSTDIFKASIRISCVLGFNLT